MVYTHRGVHVRQNGVRDTRYTGRVARGGNWHSAVCTRCPVELGECTHAWWLDTVVYTACVTSHGRPTGCFRRAVHARQVEPGATGAPTTSARCAAAAVISSSVTTAMLRGTTSWRASRGHRKPRRKTMAISGRARHAGLRQQSALRCAPGSNGGLTRRRAARQRAGSGRNGD